MVEQDKSVAMPRLRFPEFRNNEAWTATKLASALRFQAGFPFPSKGFNNERVGVRLIRNRDLRSNETSIYFSGSYSNEYLVRDGDILVGMDGDFTPCVWAGGEALLNQRVGRIIPKEGSGKKFLLYFLMMHLKAIEETTARTTVKHLSHSDVEKIFEPMPCTKEQQKIADCLTSLDEVIAAQGRKVEALKAHKRGLMQQLFPREGETRPRLRFPEFRNAPEWEETTIGEIGRFYYGKSAPKWSLEAEAPTRCVRYGELYTKFGAVITETFSRTNIDPKNLRFSKGGEILVPRVGEKPEDFGKCCCYLPLANVAIGEMISVFETAQIPLFYTYYFRNLYRHFAKVVEGQNVKNLYYAELEPLAICRPSLEEQQRIADCLSFLDIQVATESNQLVALKTHKRGLMQQLFPAPESVSA